MIIPMLLMATYDDDYDDNLSIDVNRFYLINAYFNNILIYINYICIVWYAIFML